MILILRTQKAENLTVLDEKAKYGKLVIQNAFLSHYLLNKSDKLWYNNTKAKELNITN